VTANVSSLGKRDKSLTPQQHRRPRFSFHHSIVKQQRAKTLKPKQNIVPFRPLKITRSAGCNKDEFKRASGAPPSFVALYTPHPKNKSTPKMEKMTLS